MSYRQILQKMKISKSLVIPLILGLFVGTQALSLIYWISFPYVSTLLPFAQLDATISHVLAPICPALLLIVLYSWMGILVYRGVNWFSRKIRTFLGPVSRSVQWLRFSDTSPSMVRERLIDHPRALLLTGIATALFLALVPYRPDLNTTGTPVGIDLHWYIEWISPMLARPPIEALSYAIGVAGGGSRPLLLIPVYLVVSTGAVSLVQALEALPAVLGPLLVLSVFFFVREAFEDEKLAGIAGLSTAFSFYITVGIWAAYYANMLGLSVGFAFLTVLFRYWKKQKMSRLASLVLLSSGLLLAHPWTWIIFLTVTSSFAATIWWGTRRWILLRAAG